MKATMVHVAFKQKDEDKDYITAEIFVPGLGVVKIKNCLSDETMKRIQEEVVCAVKLRLGQTLQSQEYQNAEVKQ